MGILALILIGIGLSFDTFAVSVSCGIVESKLHFWQASRIAVCFALFQAIMPIIGWLLGLSIKSYIIQFDHWIAFGLLAFVGGKMIIESFKNPEEKNFNPRKIKTVIILSFATTIDAFAVGISLAFLKVNMPLATFIIGSITFIIAMLGLLFGKKMGERSGKKMEILGGIILIALGVKILIEHLIN
jgi:putative Mn2+ efflux pump MntP